MYNLVEMGLACETTMSCMLLSKFLCYPIARVSHAICRIFEFCALLVQKVNAFATRSSKNWEEEYVQETLGFVMYKNLWYKN